MDTIRSIQELLNVGFDAVNNKNTTEGSLKVIINKLKRAEYILERRKGISETNEQIISEINELEEKFQNLFLLIEQKKKNKINECEK